MRVAVLTTSYPRYPGDAAGHFVADAVEHVRWGPHSFYVALIVETGLVGTVAFFLFLRYLFARLHAARELGRRLAAQGNAVAARVSPMAWGMTAALAGTMAANLFYLTMQFCS
jgi:O-antigen ligase